MRFYLDEDLSPAIAQLLRRRGYDATSAQQLLHRGWTDEEQLAYAGMQGRVFVTHNAGDFIRISREAFESKRPHAGIAVCSSSFSGDEVAAIASALITLTRQYPHGLGEYDLVYIRPK